MGQLDKTDVEILQVLQKDAKVNTKELSEKLHISCLLYTSDAADD